MLPLYLYSTNIFEHVTRLAEFKTTLEKVSGQRERL